MNYARLCIAAMQITLPSLLVMVALLIHLQVNMNLINHINNSANVQLNSCGY